ncbi:hypothetical protein CAPTEDRAFT_166110 [Capitella teleta]|uniref:Sulfatase N-terminal domain-containing protein n=1 Tax=Capitella teleta TaxID=283909 RepID=R7VKV0_CAPTE|nr:hypothetical protein CAPTEDRAFT_166110 [Capitella teleta]|eukprot:ELU17681.1 hypothetical protein CAPTEDRAFT_166110 [Capitella teleta]
MRLTFLFVCLLPFVLSRHPNVLFLVVDDMRPQLGCFEGEDFPAHPHPQMHTPNIDALAARSLLLKRAHVQQAVCAPSRASVLTGRRPDTTRVHDFLHYWRETGGNFTTIPQYFKENGYKSVGMGKVFHPGHSSGQDDPISWSEKYFHADNSHWESRMHNTWLAVNDSEAEQFPLEDMQLAAHAKQTLKRLTNETQPFFLAVGFHRPHLPFVVPQRFFDLYPRDEVSLPSNPNAPIGMPEIAWADNGELRQYKDMRNGKWYGAINDTLPDEVTLNLRRAYYSAISYTDSLIGDVLSTLDDLGLRDDTIISFWADHGWQLGEHGEWSKSSNFELATHAPMMVSVPGMTDHGVVTEALTEFVDLFPSLVELTGLPAIPLCQQNSSNVLVCHEGCSFVPLITDPKRNWKRAVYSQYPRMYISGDVIMGYAMRTQEHRYTEWLTYDAGTYTPTANIHSRELYDHVIDPDENVNRVNYPEYASIVKELHSVLHAGWRKALPPNI